MITPDEFDTLVQDTLRDVDARTAPTSALADKYLAGARNGARVSDLDAHRHRRRIAPLLAAAAVVAVVIGLAWANNHGRTGPVPPATRTPTVHSSPNPAPTPAPRPSHSPTVPAPAPKVAHFTVTSVSYLDARRGWAVGDGPCRASAKTDCATILRTVDGGRHWEPIGVPGGLGSTRDEGSCGSNGTIVAPCIDSVVFGSDRVGYAWSNHNLYLTTDGGARWTDLHASLVRQVIVVGHTAVRMTTRSPCSDGCAFGVSAAPLGTSQWRQIVPFSSDGVADWQLVGSSRVAYLLEQLPDPSNMATPATQALYRSTDGTHWTRVTGGGPCGTRAIDRLSLDVAGTLDATCY